MYLRKCLAIVSGSWWGIEVRDVKVPGELMVGVWDEEEEEEGETRDANSLNGAMVVI
jgi:hypothetical protein